MGQIADDMVSGFMCSWCGVCFEEEHEYPVVCEGCGRDVTDEELKELGLQRAINKEM